MRGVDGVVVRKLGSYAGDCGPFIREGRVGGNEVASRGILAGRKHNLIQFEVVLVSLVFD